MFLDKVLKGIGETGSHLCVGLDPDMHRLPERYERTAGGVGEFLEWVIDETRSNACVYKPNSAFFEALGAAGVELLGRTIGCIRDMGRPVILDAKRGDIANTARAYASAAFDILKADAITLVPYMGVDTVKPFLERGGFAFILTLPTNPSAQAIVDHGDPPLYLQVAAMANGLAAECPDQIGLVVGATRPAMAARLHEVSPGLPWLVPGVGAQGGSLSGFFSELQSEHLMVVNASRSIIFADRPAVAAWEMKERIGGYLDG